MIAKLRQQFEKLVWTDYLYSYGMPGRLAAGVMRFVVAVIRRRRCQHRPSMIHPSSDFGSCDFDYYVVSK